MRDLGDEDDVARAKTAAEVRVRQEVEDLRRVLEMPSGRAFLWRVLKFTGVVEMAPSDKDDWPRYEGRRDVGLEITNQCFTASPRGYMLMREEAIAREREE